MSDFIVCKEDGYWLARDTRTGQLAQGRSIEEAKQNSIALFKLIERLRRNKK